MLFSWQALFFVLALVLSISILHFSFAEVANNTNQGNTTTVDIKPEKYKTWVATNPIQCLYNPWEQDWLKSHNNNYTAYEGGGYATEAIKNYYQKLGITIYKLKSMSWGSGFAVCAACSCSAGDTMYLLVSNSDVDKMLKLSYMVAIGDLKKDMDLAPLQIVNEPSSPAVPSPTPIKKNLPPLRQISSGTLSESVVCSDGLVLMKKLADNSPACVKPQTAQKLVERGWGEITSMNKTNPESTCKASGGQWDEKYRECVGVSSGTCKALNGTYNECASACRHTPPSNGDVCIAVCEQVCTIK